MDCLTFFTAASCFSMGYYALQLVCEFGSATMNVRWFAMLTCGND